MKRLILTPKRIKAFDPAMVAKQDVDFKPSGLWYSCGSDWLQWTKAERYSPHRYRYVIRTAAALDAFGRKFIVARRQERRRRRSLRYDPIDWAAVAEQASGIEICPYIRSRRLGVLWYYGWDVASGCIWRGDAIISISEVSMKTVTGKR